MDISYLFLQIVLKKSRFYGIIRKTFFEGEIDMFDNIGSKIKTLAQVVCWLGIIASFLVGIILIVQDEDTALIGFLVLVLGSLFSWIGSFMTYGFGQLIENSDILVAEKNGNKTENTRPIETINDKIDTLNKWKEQGLITEQEYNQKMENLK